MAHSTKDFLWPNRLTVAPKRISLIVPTVTLTLSNVKARKDAIRKLWEDIAWNTSTVSNVANNLKKLTEKFILPLDFSTPVWYSDKSFNPKGFMKIPLARAINLLKTAAAIVVEQSNIVSIPFLDDGETFLSLKSGEYPVFDFSRYDNQEVEVSGYDMILAEESGGKINLMLCVLKKLEND